MSPRQGQQAGLIAISGVFFLWMLVSGDDVVAGLIGLIATIALAFATLRYYRAGGKPLDRGGEPFWRRKPRA